jgi:hypothetical protein
MADFTALQQQNETNALAVNAAKTKEQFCASTFMCNLPGINTTV